MKYNNTVEYKDLKLQERIRSGEYNLKVSGQIELTRTFKIMYGKKGVHIVPIDDKGD